MFLVQLVIVVILFQAPDRFMVAAARNPVCNLSLMIGTTDIPDWCYAVACGSEGRQHASESPSPDHLRLFYQKSPIAHISKVHFCSRLHSKSKKEMFLLIKSLFLKTNEPEKSSD